MNDEMRPDSGQGCAREPAGRGQQNLEVAAMVLASRQQFDAVVGMERLPTDSWGSTTPSVPSAGAAVVRSTAPIKVIVPSTEVGLAVTVLIAGGSYVERRGGRAIRHAGNGRGHLRCHGITGHAESH